MASNSTDEKEHETSSVAGGPGANAGIDTRVWRDQAEEAQRAGGGGGFERATSQEQEQERDYGRAKSGTRTTRDQMAFEAEMLSRSGRGSMRRGVSGDRWV